MITQAIKFFIPVTFSPTIRGDGEDAFNAIEWPEGFTPPTWAEVQAKAAELRAAQDIADVKEVRLQKIVNNEKELLDAMLEFFDMMDKQGKILTPKLQKAVEKYREFTQ